MFNKTIGMTEQVKILESLGIKFDTEDYDAKKIEQLKKEPGITNPTGQLTIKNYPENNAISTISSHLLTKIFMLKGFAVNNEHSDNKQLLDTVEVLTNGLLALVSYIDPRITELNTRVEQLVGDANMLSVTNALLEQTQVELLHKQQQIELQNKILEDANEEIRTQNELLAENTKEFEYMAKHDYLTRLYNFQAIMEIFEKQWNKCYREKKSISLLIIDIDHFKLFNDTYGHQMGNAVLIAVATFLQKSLRDYDYCARFGGEEFIAILPGVDNVEAKEIAERVRLNISKITRDDIENFDFLYASLAKDKQEILDLAFKKQEGFINISGGLATVYPGKVRKLDETINIADRNLYWAKEKGRNRIVSDEDRP